MNPREDDLVAAPFDLGPEPPDLIVELATPPLHFAGPTRFAELVGLKLPRELAQALARPLFEDDLDLLDELQARAVAVPSLPAPLPLERFVRLFTELPPEQVQEAAGAAVLRVYRRPRVGPSSISLSALASRDPKVLFQGYLQPPVGVLNTIAPYTSVWGINALEGMFRPGGQGRHARVFVLEGGFDIPDTTSTWLHADLPKLTLAWGENLATWKQHGLSDLGIFAAVPRNDVGLRGIANQATIVPMGLAPPGATDVNVYRALLTTLKMAKPGDVVHIAWTPFVKVWVGAVEVLRAVPPQVDPAVWQLILWATLSGVTVVQAAGNDAADLGTFTPVDSAFASGLANSNGSLIVGACSPKTGSRVGATGHGPPVQFFAWGDWVATLARGVTSPLDSYTALYDGTSAASAIVSACCTVMQGMCRTQFGSSLPPLLLKHILYQTGTPPLFGTTLTGARMPNLGAAARSLGLA